MIIARFGYEAFYVNAGKGCYTIDGFNLEYGKELEKQGTTGAKPITFITQKKVIKGSFSIHLDARFVDVDAKIKAWQDMAESTSLYAFSIGGVMLSSNKFLVSDTKVSNIRINGRGKKLSADLQIDFEEYAGKGTKIGVHIQRIADYE